MSTTPMTPDEIRVLNEKMDQTGYHGYQTCPECRGFARLLIGDGYTIACVECDFRPFVGEKPTIAEAEKDWDDIATELHERYRPAREFERRDLEGI
jgi:hypothetical protein